MPAPSNPAAGMHCCAQVAIVGHFDLSHPVDGFGASSGQHGMSSAITPGDVPGIAAIMGATPLMATAPPNGMDAKARKIAKARSLRRMGREVTLSLCHNVGCRESGDA